MSNYKRPEHKVVRRQNYELFVPMVSNSGRRISKAKMQNLRSLLITKFGGLTYYPQINKGFWKIGNVTFRDEIVILRVLCDRSPAVARFWSGLKSNLEKQWKQKELLIMVYDVHIL